MNEFSCDLGIEGLQAVQGESIAVPCGERFWGAGIEGRKTVQRERGAVPCGELLRRRGIEGGR
mgnify:CR=1 FL=1